MPEVECFVDTNVLVYAISTLPQEAAKPAIARDILDKKGVELVRAGCRRVHKRYYISKAIATFDVATSRVLDWHLACISACAN